MLVLPLLVFLDKNFNYQKYYSDGCHDMAMKTEKVDFDAKLKNISDRVTNNKSKDLLLDNELKKIKNTCWFFCKDKI